MKSAAREIFGTAKRRGFWLRCFLGLGSISAFALMLAARSADAQIVVLKPLHLSHVYGYVLSEKGEPLTGVPVALVSGGPPAQATTTDAKGYFDFPDAKGEYLLHVKMPHSAIAARNVIVGADFRALFHRGPLNIMIKPGGCEDCTSPIFTSRKQFDRVVQENRVNHG